MLGPIYRAARGVIAFGKVTTGVVGFILFQFQVWQFVNTSRQIMKSITEARNYRLAVELLSKLRPIGKS